MPIGILQIPLTGAAQPILSGGDLVVKTLVLQNNSAANAVRVGDNTVAAAKGINLADNGGILQLTNAFAGIHLAGIYVIGTAEQVLDVLYDTGL